MWPLYLERRLRPQPLQGEMLDISLVVQHHLVDQCLRRQRHDRRLSHRLRCRWLRLRLPLLLLRRLPRGVLAFRFRYPHFLRLLLPRHNHRCCSQPKDRPLITPCLEERLRLPQQPLQGDMRMPDSSLVVQHPPVDPLLRRQRHDRRLSHRLRCR
jgi:hypothetical protein